MNKSTSRDRAAAAASARRNGRRNPNVSTKDGSVSEFSDEQNKDLLKMAGFALAGLAAFRILTSYLYLIITCPFLFFYMFTVCPSEESFDAKKELKRVMRGHHLPEDHPDKPKGFLSETFARVTAAVTTELATGLGYEITMYNLYQTARLVWVRVPAAKMDFYWIGAFSRWTYVYSAEIPDDKND